MTAGINGIRVCNYKWCITMKLPSVECKICGKAVYCSKEHLEKDAASHKRVCGAKPIVKAQFMNKVEINGYGVCFSAGKRMLRYIEQEKFLFDCDFFSKLDELKQQKVFAEAFLYNTVPCFVRYFPEKNEFRVVAVDSIAEASTLKIACRDL